MQGVTRVVQVIEYLGTHGSASIEDVADELGVHKSSASRLLATLRKLGWVSSNDARTSYTLGHRLIGIGQAAVPDIGMEQALATAAALRELTGETVHLSVPDTVRHQMLVIARVDSKSPLRVTQPVGSLDPLHSTAVGKVYLASLADDVLDDMIGSLPLDQFAPSTITTTAQLRAEIDRVRAQGFAINAGESRMGITAAAVLLRLAGERSTPVALSITGPATRWSPARIAETMPEVLDVVGPFLVRLGSA
ncbi:MAG: IclR family transcriptional regulator [Actinomycetota bacterium]|nr:IclR family transcriptional regulator [Actinomycetota bacterium]